MLAPWKKTHDQPSSILKNRDITLPTKVYQSELWFSQLVMYSCESWAIKKAVHRRIDAFELWCWRLENPLDCKKIKLVNPQGDQSWLFSGRTDAEWNFSFSISLSNEYSGLISFRIDWFDFFAVQGTLKSLLQHHTSKASILRCTAFFIAQLSQLYMTNWENHSSDW